MKYRVYWTRTAVRDLRGLEKRVAERMAEAIEEASLSPLRYFKKLKGMPLHSLRIGDYRAIASLDHERHSIVVLVVEHRRRAYKKAKRL